MTLAAAPSTAAPVGTARCAALAALDPVVRPLLRRLLPPPLFPPVVGLTIYDTEPARRPQVGGHWTAAVRLPVGPVHCVLSYTVRWSSTQRSGPSASGWRAPRRW
jgi:hypothetical protein